MAKWWPVYERPSPLDVVWCKFPYIESVGSPGPKARPALVKTVFLDDDGHIFVEVVYGTSKIAGSRVPFQLTVTNAEQRMCAGLPQATRFDLDRVIILPWNDDWFVARNGKKTPVVGSLHPLSAQMLQSISHAKKKRDEIKALEKQIKSIENELAEAKKALKKKPAPKRKKAPPPG